MSTGDSRESSFSYSESEDGEGEEPAMDPPDDSEDEEDEEEEGDQGGVLVAPPLNWGLRHSGQLG